MSRMDGPITCSRLHKNMHDLSIEKRNRLFDWLKNIMLKNNFRFSSIQVCRKVNFYA